MLRDLLVHVDGSLAGRTRVQLAVKLAACAGAKLSGIHVTPPIEVPSRVRPTGIADMTAYFSAMQTVESQAAADTFEGAVLGHLADAGWSEVQGDVAQSICDHARYTDLVILGQYEWQGTPAKPPAADSPHRRGALRPAGSGGACRDINQSVRSYCAGLGWQPRSGAGTPRRPAAFMPSTLGRDHQNPVLDHFLQRRRRTSTGTSRQTQASPPGR